MSLKAAPTGHTAYLSIYLSISLSLYLFRLGWSLGELKTWKTKILHLSIDRVWNYSWYKSQTYLLDINPVPHPVFDMTRTTRKISLLSVWIFKESDLGPWPLADSFIESQCPSHCTLSIYISVPFHEFFLRVIRQARPSATHPSYYTRGALKTGGGCRAGREIFLCGIRQGSGSCV